METRNEINYDIVKRVAFLKDAAVMFPQEKKGLRIVPSIMSTVYPTIEIKPKSTYAPVIRRKLTEKEKTFLKSISYKVKPSIFLAA